MHTNKGKSPNFEKSLAELEKIVNRMEQSEQTLDRTLKDFERGMELSRICQKNLQEAEQRVEQLIKKHGQLELEPLKPDQGLGQEKNEDDDSDFYE